MESRNSRIKRALKEKKVSQEKLGEALSITSQAVSDRLNSDKEVDSVEFLKAVSSLTKIPVWELLEDDPDLSAMAKAEHGIAQEPPSKYYTERELLVKLLRAHEHINYLEKEIEKLRKDSIKS